MYNHVLRFWKHLFNDIYYWNIPLYCRDCNYLEDCRHGWLKRRKCRDGCLILNTKRQQEREQEIEALLDFVEAQEQRRTQNRKW